MEQGLSVAEAARRRIGESAQDIFCRGDPSHFADRDGRLREVAWNPDRKLADDGSMQSPSGLETRTAR